jgi:hypothetical protein
MDHGLFVAYGFSRLLQE